MEQTDSAVHLDDRRHLTPLEDINGALPEMQVADIVLVRHKKGLLRFFLREITRSYWDHSAMIIFSKHPVKGYNSNIIAEAVQHGSFDFKRRGVEIHKLEEYLNHPELYDVGVKRFAQADETMRDRVRAFMLMNVDAPYYRLPVADLFVAWLSKAVARQVLRRQRFSCSGLVQKAFYSAADWTRREEFSFREFGDSPIELQELVSPADIAASDKCAWIWNGR